MCTCAPGVPFFYLACFNILPFALLILGVSLVAVLGLVVGVGMNIIVRWGVLFLQECEAWEPLGGLGHAPPQILIV